MDTSSNPKRNLPESHQSGETPATFLLVIQKGIDPEGIEFLSIKSQNDRIPLPEIILIIETWLEKTREHYKNSLAGIHFKT